MAKKSTTIKFKHVSEDEANKLQQLSLEDLLKEERKVRKSLQRLSEKKKTDVELLKAKKKLENHHNKNKQSELKEIEGYKKAMKEARAAMNEGAEETVADIKEINRHLNMDKAPYLEKKKLIERMITEKEFKI